MIRLANRTEPIPEEVQKLVVQSSKTTKSSSSPRFVSADSFVCRYTWIPKLVRALNEDSSFLADKYDAMVKLGVGSNMVSAIKIWGKEMGIIEKVPGGGDYSVTDFGEEIFGEGDLDRFLEDQNTLWLLHWNLCAKKDPLHAWHYLINHWHKSDFSQSEVLAEFAMDDKSTEASRKRHLDVFLRTYVGSSSAKNDVQEDNLDCPLVELNFIRKIGDRAISTNSDSGKREAIYSFRFEEKPEISDEVFIYCLADYWSKYRSSEKTLDFATLSTSPRSIGQVFKLPEAALRKTLEDLEDRSGGIFIFDDSAAIPRVSLDDKLPDPVQFLESIYMVESDE